MLSKIRFVPGQEQSGHTIFWMRFLMAWVPFAMYLISALSLLRFPCTRDIHRKVHKRFASGTPAPHEPSSAFASGANGALTWRNSFGYILIR
jgi:Na+/melibiose symporter-like transporter